MNAAAKVLPLKGKSVIPCTPAELAWIQDSAERLMMGDDIKFKRRLHSPQGVTFERFAVAVDEFAMQQLSSPGASQSALGRLILSAKFGSPAEARSDADGVLSVSNPAQALREIAEALLRPIAADALVAQAEDDEL